MADNLTNKDLEKVVAECAEVARLMWEKGWAEMNAGNISVDVTEFVPETLYDLNRFTFAEAEIDQRELAGRSILVSGAGSRMRDLAADPSRFAYILRVSDKLDGYHKLWGGRYGESNKPTSEFSTHLAIHQAFRQKSAPEKAVIHTHPSELIALTHKAGLTEDALNRLLWSMHPEMKILVPRGVGYVPFQLPGSRTLARATLKALEGHDIVLWEKHGCLAVGSGMREALDLIEIVNKSARIHLLCKSAGMEPEGLAPEQLAELEKMSRKKEGRGE